MSTQAPLPNQDPFSWRDTNSLRFLVQFFFSTLILSFCIFQLAKPEANKDNSALYWSCLSGILALWMPSPSAARSSPSSFSNEPERFVNSNADFNDSNPEILDGKNSQRQEVSSLK